MNKENIIMNNGVDTMNLSTYKKMLYNQTPLKILSFLSLHPTTVFSARDVSQSTRASKGATHQTLKLLSDLDIIRGERKGNLFLYKLNAGNIILKQFKIFENLLTLCKLVQLLKTHCQQIILFGSYANGTNYSESDIDLFVKSEEKDVVSKTIHKYKSGRFKINAITQDALEIAAAGKADKIFYEQVKKGIILWEGDKTNE